MSPLLRSAFALLLLLLLTTSLVSAQDTQIPLICHDDSLQVIAVVGGNVPNGTDSYGLTVTFVQKITSIFPSSANFSVNYNRFHDVNHTSQTFIPEVCEGVPALWNAVQSYTAACPKTPVVLHGYSEGAVVVGNLLCGASSAYFPQTKPLNASYASQIIAVVLYGDETRTANQSFNLGGCTANAPHLPRLRPHTCDAFAPNMQSYCFPNDIDCCATANASAPYPYGINPHYLYPAGYDNSAVDFVVGQWGRYRNGTLGANTTTTTSSGVSSTATASSKSSSTTTSTLSTTSSTSTTTTPSFTPTPTPTPTTCTPDKCLSSFSQHPTSASRFCSSLSAATTSATIATTIFPTVCAGNYASRVSSVCGCLGLLGTAGVNGTVS